MGDRTCDVDGCERPHEAKGLCHNHYANAWYHAHADQARATQAVYRETTRATDRQRAAAWREANPDRTRAARRAWYAEHADQVREYKRRYRGRTATRSAHSTTAARPRNAASRSTTSPPHSGPESRPRSASAAPTAARSAA